MKMLAKRNPRIERSRPADFIDTSFAGGHFGSVSANIHWFSRIGGVEGKTGQQGVGGILTAARNVVVG
jgi:hypothetical protein